VIQRIIQDWFKIVHPVAPILHRNTFIARLRDASSFQDLDFLILVVSICAATVSTLRRSSGSYASMITVEKCHQIISAANQNRDPSHISLEKCQAMYNMSASLTQERGMDDQTVQILGAETLAATGHLLHYDQHTLSFCDRELVKRIHWLCFAGQWSGSLHLT
jgi:hypothetical protein